MRKKHRSFSWQSPQPTAERKSGSNATVRKRTKNNVIFFVHQLWSLQCEQEAMGQRQSPSVSHQSPEDALHHGRKGLFSSGWVLPGKEGKENIIESINHCLAYVVPAIWVSSLSICPMLWSFHKFACLMLALLHSWLYAFLLTLFRF